MSNELILDNLKRLLETPASLFVRIPLIPSVNGSNEEMMSIRGLLGSIGYPEKIEFLPYHTMGEHKYRALGMKTP